MCSILVQAAPVRAKSKQMGTKGMATLDKRLLLVYTLWYVPNGFSKKKHLQNNTLPQQISAGMWFHSKP